MIRQFRKERKVNIALPENRNLAGLRRFRDATLSAPAIRQAILDAETYQGPPRHELAPHLGGHEIQDHPGSWPFLRATSETVEFPNNAVAIAAATALQRSKLKDLEEKINKKRKRGKDTARDESKLNLGRSMSFNRRSVLHTLFTPGARVSVPTNRATMDDRVELHKIDFLPLQAIGRLGRVIGRVGEGKQDTAYLDQTQGEEPYDFCTTAEMFLHPSAVQLQQAGDRSVDIITSGAHQIWWPEKLNRPDEEAKTGSSALAEFMHTAVQLAKARSESPGMRFEEIYFNYFSAFGSEMGSLYEEWMKIMKLGKHSRFALMHEWIQDRRKELGFR